MPKLYFYCLLLRMCRLWADPKADTLTTQNKEKITHLNNTKKKANQGLPALDWPELVLYDSLFEIFQDRETLSALELTGFGDDCQCIAFFVSLGLLDLCSECHKRQ